MEDTTNKSTSGTKAIHIVLSLLALTYAGLVFAIVHGVMTGWLNTLWIALEGAGQASVITGALTLLASITAAVLLPYLLGGQIREVRQVADEAKRYLQVDLKQTTEEANRILAVIEQQAYRAEGILTHGDGDIQVKSNEHARELTGDLYEAARRYSKEMLKSKKGLWGKTKAELESQTDMSKKYLKSLERAEVITNEAYEFIELIRATYRAWTKPISGTQVNDMNSKLLALIDEQKSKEAEDNEDRD